MTARLKLTNQLRDRIVGALHVGHLHGGDRLPSIREVARETGMNARTVALAYRALEAEGLVEVQGRSGVFVGREGTRGDERQEETTRWLSGFVAEAWKRRFSVGELSGLISRCTLSRPLRCALVESLEDVVVAFGHELRQEWGFDLQVIDPAILEQRGPGRIAGLQHVDLFVATSFHALRIRDAIELLGKPLVVLTIHEDLQAAVRARMRDGNLTVVAVDPQFGDRIRVAYGDGFPRDVVRQVLAGDTKAVRALDPAEPVLLTRAAREMLGDIRLPTIFPHSPTISSESARALASILVARNLSEGDK